MQITINVSSEIIANMMISAMESGDPVTTAARGGWCAEINNKSCKSFKGDWWYADPKYFEGEFKFNVVEVDDETTGHQTTHTVRPGDMARGLAVMAQKYGHLFAHVLNDDTDAPCADIFLQCILFGEEKYA
jgi:hypothetical protein